MNASTATTGAEFDRILICGAIFADNLGDGIIAECLTHQMAQLDVKAPVELVDLSTRRDFGHAKISGKRRILNFLRTAPRWISRPALVVGLFRFYLFSARPAWSRLFAERDLVVIGGGHLLSDFNLNFPVKIALLTSYARRAGATVVIYAVGVSRRWSRLGTWLLKRSLSGADLVVVRDRDSAALLSHHLPQFGGVRWDPDPGFLAKDTYGGGADAAGQVGLNVSDPTELAAYGSNAVHPEDYDKFWLELARHYAGLGRQVIFFTNGAVEDESYLEHLRSSFGRSKLASQIRFAPRPRRPAELVDIIRGLDLLIGHRLHSHIVAFSYSVPSVALGWDAKLKAHLQMMGRSEFMLDFDAPDPLVAIELAVKSQDRPIDPAAQAMLQRRAANGVRDMIIEAAQARRRATDSAG